MTIAAVATLTAVTWAAKAAEPFNIDNVKTISATVESIDNNGSLVWLRDHEGRSLRVVVPTEVRHLAQVKVGDKLVVRYHDSVTATIRPKRSGKTPSDVDHVARDASQAKPDVVSSRANSTTVVIQSVDKSAYSIAYKDANGFSRNTTIKDPEARKFVATLNAGDQVEITYSEAVAVSAELEK